MGRMHVAHLDRRALARQAAGAEGRQAPPVREPGERVRLIHELRELRGAEELLQRRDDRPNVDDRLRRDRVDVLRRHPLADDPLHAVEAHPERLLDQLADRAQPPVAEVLVLVEVAADRIAREHDRVGGKVLRLEIDTELHRQLDELADEREDVLGRQDARALLDVHLEPLIELVAADLGQVVALRVEEQRLEQVAGVVERRRLTRPLLLEDLDQGLLLGLGGVLLERVDHERRVVEELQDRLVRARVQLEPGRRVLLRQRSEQGRDRQLALPVTTLLRALPEEDPSTGFKLDTSTNEAILKLFDNSPFMVNTLEKDPSETEEEALIEVFKKQRPGEPPTLDNARNLLKALFFDPKRYDLTKVGRYKLNQRLEVNVKEGTRVLTTEDILALVRKLVELPIKLGVDLESKDFAADAVVLSRDPIRGDLDEYEHFGNRRLRTVGELIQEAFRVGLYRMERVVRERMTTEDVDTITPQTIINIRPVVAALKEFFGSSQLSQFMDQTNSLAGLTHRRRLSALGAGGLTRERAPIEVRDVHPTHYGRM